MVQSCLRMCLNYPHLCPADMAADVLRGPPWAPALEARACSELGVMASQV